MQGSPCSHANETHTKKSKRLESIKATRLPYLLNYIHATNHTNVLAEWKLLAVVTSFPFLRCGWVPPYLYAKFAIQETEVPSCDSIFFYFYDFHVVQNAPEFAILVGEAGIFSGEGGRLAFARPFFLFFVGTVLAHGASICFAFLGGMFPT
jgi:hypothetical protein